MPGVQLHYSLRGCRVAIEFPELESIDGVIRGLVEPSSQFLSGLSCAVLEHGPGSVFMYFGRKHQQVPTTCVDHCF